MNHSRTLCAGRWPVCFAVVSALWLACAVTDSHAQPSAALTQGLRGYFLEASGDPAGAITALRDAVAADPESVELRISLAQLLAVRNPADALAAVDEGLQTRQGNVKLLVLRARLLEYSSRREEAAAAWLKAVEKGAGDEAYGGVVRTLESLERHREAEEQARRWVEQSPKSVEAAFALGHVLLRKGDKLAARKALENALELAPSDINSLRTLAVVEEDAGNDEAAAELYQKLINTNPHDVDARFRLAQVLVRLQRLDEAVSVLQGAQKWMGSDTSLPLRLGVLFLQADRPAEAESALRPYAEKHPSDARAWYLLGVSLLAQEKYELALTALERVPADAEEYPEALARRAAGLDSLKRGAEAVKLLEGWLESHPGDEGVLLFLADLLEAQGDTKAAVELLEAHVGKSSTKNARVYFALGVLWDKLKDWRKSADYMKRSLALNPDDPHALNYLGYTYAEQGANLEEAEKLVLRALELKPEDGAITDSLGWVYFKQGRYAEAAIVLKRAASLLPKDPIIWEHAGDALKASGDVEGARDAYRKAVDLAPESESAKKKLQEMP